jgi:hypothetical protein
VVKTVYLDLIISFLVCAIIPYAARENLRENDGFFNRYFLVVLLFEIFVLMPIGGYLFIKYPAWSLMYTIDPATLSPLAPIKLIYAYLATGIIGYGFCFFAVEGKNDGAAVGAISFAVLLLIIGIVLGIFRLLSVGTYAQWSSNEDMSFLLGTRLFLELIFIAIWFCVPIVHIVRKLARGW